MKIWQKYLTRTAIVVICLVAVSLSVLEFFSKRICGNTIYTEEYSPDRQLKAMVFERNCGATSGFSTQISILPAASELKNESGNIYILSGHPNHLKLVLTWETNASLLIHGETASTIYKNEETWGLLDSVSIKYTKRQ